MMSVMLKSFSSSSFVFSSTRQSQQEGCWSASEIRAHTHIPSKINKLSNHLSADRQLQLFKQGLSYYTSFKKGGQQWWSTHPRLSEFRIWTSDGQLLSMLIRLSSCWIIYFRIRFELNVIESWWKLKSLQHNTVPAMLFFCWSNTC